MALNPLTHLHVERNEHSERRRSERLKEMVGSRVTQSEKLSPEETPPREERLGPTQPDSDKTKNSLA